MASRSAPTTIPTASPILAPIGRPPPIAATSCFPIAVPLLGVLGVDGGITVWEP